MRANDTDTGDATTEPPASARTACVPLWPVAHAPVRVAVELQCDRCGYKIRFRAANKPRDYETMFADFQRKHPESGACHDTTHEGQS